MSTYTNIPREILRNRPKIIDIICTQYLAGRRRDLSPWFFNHFNNHSFSLMMKSTQELCRELCLKPRCLNLVMGKLKGTLWRQTSRVSQKGGLCLCARVCVYALRDIWGNIKSKCGMSLSLSLCAAIKVEQYFYPFGFQYKHMLVVDICSSVYMAPAGN